MLPQRSIAGCSVENGCVLPGDNGTVFVGDDREAFRNQGLLLIRTVRPVSEITEKMFPALLITTQRMTGGISYHMTSHIIGGRSKTSCYYHKS